MKAKTAAECSLTPAPSAAGTAGAPATRDPKEFALDGLYLSGQCIGRQRREFPGKDGKPTRFVIVVTVLTADGVHKPERWSDTAMPSDVPAVGDHVCLKVRIGLFTPKGGGTGYRLSWGPPDNGTEF